MQKKYFKILTKQLSNEATEEETKFLFDEINKNDKLKKEYDEIVVLWNSLTLNKKSFDKERILKLIARKISAGKKQKQNKIIYSTLKYAAVFIGLLVISLSVYKDLHSIKTIVNNTGKIKKIVLPDNTIVTLNKNAKISYNNSTLKSFNRKINLTGEAFFEVSKKDNKKFTVKTDAYDITVLGTKFNVRTFKNENSVVLSEGEILLNNFRKANNTEILMKPGQIVKFSPQNNTFILKNINPEIYTSWMKNKLEFNHFSLTELAELFKVRYNKILIVKNNNAQNKYISGSAPADDVHLILKALQSIFKSEIIEKNDTVIIN